MPTPQRASSISFLTKPTRKPHTAYSVSGLLKSEVYLLSAILAPFRQRDPSHPSLRFRRLQAATFVYDPHRQSIQALDRLTGERLEWAWIGTHAEYDRLTAA